MSPESIVTIITSTLTKVAGSLVAALVNGDQDAWKRVQDLIPEPLRSEAKLIKEEARLRRLEGEAGGGDT